MGRGSTERQERRRKNKERETREKLKFFSINSTSAPPPRPRVRYPSASERSDTVTRTHLLPPLRVHLSPASGAVGGSPRRNLSVDLGPGLFCPGDERAGPRGAGRPPRDVEPGLVERRELSDLWSEWILGAIEREKRPVRKRKKKNLGIVDWAASTEKISLLPSSFPLLSLFYSSTHRVRVDLDSDAESSARGRDRDHGSRRNRQESGRKPKGISRVFFFLFPTAVVFFFQAVRNDSTSTPVVLEKKRKKTSL